MDGMDASKGDKGEKGETGVKGDMGEKGEIGVPGLRGPQGMMVRSHTYIRVCSVCMKEEEYIHTWIKCICYVQVWLTQLFTAFVMYV